MAHSVRRCWPVLRQHTALIFSNTYLRTLLAQARTASATSCTGRRLFKAKFVRQHAKKLVYRCRKGAGSGRGGPGGRRRLQCHAAVRHHQCHLPAAGTHFYFISSKTQICIVKLSLIGDGEIMSENFKLLCSNSCRLKAGVPLDAKKGVSETSSEILGERADTGQRNDIGFLVVSDDWERWRPCPFGQDELARDLCVRGMHRLSAVGCSHAQPLFVARHDWCTRQPHLLGVGLSAVRLYRNCCKVRQAPLTPAGAGADCTLSQPGH